VTRLAPTGAATEGAGSLRVVCEGLEQAAARLEAAQRATGEFFERHTVSLSTADAAGDPAVAEAIDSFVRRWSYGLSCLRADVGSLSRALQGAAEAYRRVEASIVADAGG
jgi:hypothetical protein